MPEAFISSTTSPGPGVGSGKVMISTARPPGKVTPRMASSVSLFRGVYPNRGPSRAGMASACRKALALLASPEINQEQRIMRQPDQLVFLDRLLTMVRSNTRDD